MISSGARVAGAHVGIGHARQGHVRERLAAAVAGRRHAHEARIELVLNVSLEHAVLDEHGALRGRALIVDVQGASPPVERAVVDHGDLVRGHLVADAVARRRRCPCG